MSDFGAGTWAVVEDANGPISGGQDATSITFTLADLTQKDFRVTTVIGSAESTPSASATNATVPQSLTFTAVDDGASKAALTWDLSVAGNAGNADFVAVQYFNDTTQEWTLIEFDPPNGNKVGILAGTVSVDPPLLDVPITYRLMTVAGDLTAFTADTDVVILPVAAPL